jgi:hypothetical protein
VCGIDENVRARRRAIKPRGGRGRALRAETLAPRRSSRPGMGCTTGTSLEGDSRAALGRWR